MQSGLQTWTWSAEVQALVDRWQAQLAADPEPASDFLARVQAAGVTFEATPLCTTRQPLLLPPELVAVYRRILGHLRIAVRAARELLVADGLDGHPDSLAVRIGVDPGALALAEVEPGYQSAAVLARFDSYLCRDADGAPCPQLIELNAESPTGMAYDEALGELFLRDPLAAGLGQRLRPFAAASQAVAEVLRTWRLWGDRSHDLPRVAIVDDLDVPTAPEFDLFQARFAAAGLPCRVLAPEQLHFDGDRLRGPDDQRVDLVYRRLLVADVLAAPDRCAPLLDAYRAGAVLVVNSFRNSLLHGKGLFALFHDPLLQDRLPHEVVATIRRHLPWTGLLLDRPGTGEPADLRARVRAEPDRWVLKPLFGHAGQGVHLGWRDEARKWQTAVDQATHHVVQERVPGPRLPFPEARHGHALEDRLLSLDPFLIRGELAGFLCRLAPGPLANVHAGAGQIPVMQLGR